jgi:hypothetical protein
MNEDDTKIRAQVLLDAAYLVHLEIMKTKDTKTLNMLSNLRLDILKLLKE